MTDRPILSIVAICYNQEEYIGQALDSFVMQQTNFPIEIIIADDCSTDKTTQIITKYANRYPDLFRPIFRKKNVGIQSNLEDALRKAKGKYIALCEGDDYWTDPKKLQKQADFLETHPDYASCFHPVRVFFENKEEPDFIAPEVTGQKEFTLKELVEQNFIYTNSVMYRRQKYDNMPENIMPVDWYLHLYHAQFGKIGFINEVMGAYRRHPGGVWWNSYANIDSIWIKHGLAHFNLYMEILKLYDQDEALRKIIYKAIFSAFETFIRLDRAHGTMLLREAVITFPEAAQEYMRQQSKQLEKAASAGETGKQQAAALQQAEQKVAKLSKEIAAIKSSKTWRLGNAVAKTRHRI